jgi:hypothetical protein
MLKKLSGNGLSLVLLLTACVGSAAAQQGEPPRATTQPAIECGGQYECVDDRPLTRTEARASLGYPHVAQPQQPTPHDPAKVAATPSTTTK